MHLIFHLSFDFGPELQDKSLNFHTPAEWCTVKYNDLDAAVKDSLRLLSEYGASNLFYAKTDCSNAFRLLPCKVKQRAWLVLKMRHPDTNIWYYFMDRCMPFGASISCAQFQKFSDGLKHIAHWRITMRLHINPSITNYLDDFLFAAITRWICNQMVLIFLQICKEINCPMSPEKTEWATQLIVFLGILLNGKLMVMSVPEEKRNKAINLLNEAIQRKKLKICEIQKLTGTLNFLNRAITTGRAFTRGMYTKLKIRDNSGALLKQHHHVNLKQDFIQDCRVWLQFLTNLNHKLCRPYWDTINDRGKILRFTSDASLNSKLGMGATFEDRWVMAQWDENFIISKK